MKYLLILALSLNCFAGPKQSGAKFIIPPVNNSLSLAPSYWWINWPLGYRVNPGTSKSGWLLGFPQNATNCGNMQYPTCDKVDYVQTRFTDGAHLSSAASITMTFAITVTSGSPMFDGRTSPDNQTLSSVFVRFLIDDRDDGYCLVCPWPPAGTDDTCCQYQRWWSNPQCVLINAQTGTATLTVNLDPALWSSVAGEFGNSNPDALAGWNHARANVGWLGFSFGANFFGHGVFIDTGTGTAVGKLPAFHLTP